MKCTLKSVPLRTTEYQAVHSYRHPQNLSKYLVIEKDQIIKITDVSGESTGWWKGEVEETGAVRNLVIYWCFLFRFFLKRDVRKDNVK